MKLVIIPIDGAVYVDDISYSLLDLTSCKIPANVHALQWNGVKGWIEFVEDENLNKPDNQFINLLPEWANQAKIKWDEAKQIEESIIYQNLENNPTSLGTQDL
jgi:hypothetical protein